MTEDTMIVADIAREAGCTAEGVRSAIKRGTLRAVQVPGRSPSRHELRVPVEDARRWIAAVIDRRQDRATRSDLRSGARGGAATKRWSRIAERLRMVKDGERAHVSLAARNKARPLVREHLARRAGDV